MHGSETTKTHEMLAAALDWWRDAGVDHAFSDESQDWLARLETASPAVAEAPPAARAAPSSTAAAAAARIGGDPARYPQELEEFARWWLTEASLDPAPASRRVPPLGRAGAELMVLVAMPEPGDEAVLLSGRAGRLLDSMLAAMGLSRDRIYLAAALPSVVPAPDWQALAASGLAQVAAHHIALAAPQRLLVLGRSVASTLLGHAPTKNSETLRDFNHEGRSLPVLACYDLEALLARPGSKAGVWKSWLEWTGSEAC